MGRSGPLRAACAFCASCGYAVDAVRIFLPAIRSTMKRMKEIAEKLGRPVVWIAGVQKRFGLPVLESYSEGYESFLRKVIHLRVLGVSEESLREFWAVERKLIEVLHLDPQSSPTWIVDACAFPSDPDRRLLLSNIDLGFPLPATDLQIGLDFSISSQDLFAGKDMGEDALKLLQDYRTRFAAIRLSVGSESKILRDALKWGQGFGVARTPGGVLVQGVVAARL